MMQEIISDQAEYKSVLYPNLVDHDSALILLRAGYAMTKILSYPNQHPAMILMRSGLSRMMYPNCICVAYILYTSIPHQYSRLDINLGRLVFIR
jgi:hypothetical protein